MQRQAKWFIMVFGIWQNLSLQIFTRFVAYRESYHSLRKLIYLMEIFRRKLESGRKETFFLSIIREHFYFLLVPIVTIPMTETCTFKTKRGTDIFWVNKATITLPKLIHIILICVTLFIILSCIIHTQVLAVSKKMNLSWQFIIATNFHYELT